METKKKLSQLSCIKDVGELNCMVGMDCTGEGRSRAGGLVLVCDSQLDVELISFFHLIICT